MNRKIQSLQAGRALAALAVVMAHSATSISNVIAPIAIGRQYIYQSGILGVDFFFLLSGYIIAHVHAVDLGKRDRIWNYISKRLKRIFLPYLPIGVAFALIYTIAPSLPGASGNWNWMSSLFLAPDAASPALHPAWTLEHEMVFYLFFATLILSVRLGIFLGIVWLSIISLCSLLGSTPSWLGRAGNIVNIEFFMGIGAFALLNRCNNGYLVQFVIVIMVLLGGTFLLHHETGVVPLDMHGVVRLIEEKRIFISLIICALMMQIICLERAGYISFFYRWLIFLGDASYAIYLTHVPAQAVAVRVLAKYSILSEWLNFAIMVSASVIAGVYFHLIFERHIMKWRFQLSPVRWFR